MVLVYKLDQQTVDIYASVRAHLSREVCPTGLSAGRRTCSGVTVGGGEFVTVVGPAAAVKGPATGQP